MPKSQPITIRLSPDGFRILKQHVKVNGVSRSAVVELALRRLDDDEQIERRLEMIENQLREMS
jgi:hypothetical protein